MYDKEYELLLCHPINRYNLDRDLEKNPDYKKGRPINSPRLKSPAKEETNARC